MLYFKKSNTFIKKKRYSMSINTFSKTKCISNFLIKKRVRTENGPILYYNMFYFNNYIDNFINFINLNKINNRYTYIYFKDYNCLTNFYNYSVFNFNSAKKYKFFFKLDYISLLKKKYKKFFKKCIKKFKINNVLFLDYYNFSIIFYFFKKFNLVTSGIIDVNSVKKLDVIDYKLLTNSNNFFYKYMLVSLMVSIYNR